MGNSANTGQTDIAARLLAGDRRALARVVTLIENGAPEARAILTREKATLERWAARLLEKETLGHGDLVELKRWLSWAWRALDARFFRAALIYAVALGTLLGASGAIGVVQLAWWRRAPVPTNFNSTSVCSSFRLPLRRATTCRS